MKKIYLVMGFLFAIGTVAIAQIPNGGFEDWEPNGDGGMDPTYWQTMNKYDFTNVVPDDGHNSPTSAKMSVEWSNSLEMYVTSMIFFDGYFDVDQRYTAVSCYYRGTSVGGDSLTLYVGMYEEDILIGYVFGGTATSSNDWQEFSLNIDYFAEGTPTKAYMELHIPTSTGPNYGTFFSVDDLAFGMGSGLPPNTTKDCSLTVFPNPVNDNALIEFELTKNQFSTIQIIDITGKVIEIVTSSDLTSGEHQFNLATQNMPNGVYYCRLLLDGQSVSKAFVVNK